MTTCGPINLIPHPNPVPSGRVHLGGVPADDADLEMLANAVGAWAGVLADADRDYIRAARWQLLLDEVRGGEMEERT
jgi:hypothetical protein